MPDDQQKAESLGIRETIQKPATAEKLAGVLERIFSEPQARIHVTGKMSPVNNTAGGTEKSQPSKVIG